MERVAAEINATKGRVADLERPRPPVAYPHGFDLCWAGYPPGYLSEGASAYTDGFGWTPWADVVIHAVTVVTGAALGSDLTVDVARVGIDTQSVTLTAGDNLATFNLGTPVAVPPGVMVRPQLTLASLAGGDATVPVTVILRGRTRADWYPSAGLPFATWTGGGA